MEITAHDEGRRTFRAVYVVKLADAVYVLHAFCKKSKHGMKTPQRELDLLERRLKAALRHWEEHYGKRTAPE